MGTWTLRWLPLHGKKMQPSEDDKNGYTLVMVDFVMGRDFVGCLDNELLVFGLGVST
jgi:hypothetical protein